MKMLLATTILATFVGHPVIAAEPPRPKIARTEADTGRLALECPMGNLGYRVGTYLQIEGFRQEQGKVGTRTLAVDRINGEKIKAPIPIWIENLKGVGLPSRKRCVLRGYESARVIGLPPEVAKAEGLPLPQAVWQMQRFFVVTSVVEPKGLEKE